MAADAVTVEILTACSRRGDPLSAVFHSGILSTSGRGIDLSFSMPCDRFATATEDAGREGGGGGDTVARCDSALQLVQLPPRRGRLHVLAGVKRDERSGGCGCLHSVPLRSAGTQRPAESSCQIRSRERRDLQVGGRSEALIIKMDSAQKSRDGRVSAARAH